MKMNKVVAAVKDAAKSVKLDQEGLDLLRVNLRKDPTRSRAILRLSSEIGIDLPGDQLENLIVLGVNAAFPGTRE